MKILKLGINGTVPSDRHSDEEYDAAKRYYFRYRLYQTAGNDACRPVVEYRLYYRINRI